MEEYIMHRFESIGEFVKASQANAVPSESSHRKGDRGGGYGDNWHGTEDFPTAVRHALAGDWDPGDLERFENMFDDIEARVRKYKTVENHIAVDQGGFEVNMQAYLDGEPDHMYEWFPEETVVTKRALCLVIGHSISSACTSEELFIRGRAAVALVRALSLLGFELEIWSEETVMGGGYGSKSKKIPDYFTTLVRLHGAGEIMDESAVEYAVGNPSWLRRLLFGFQEGQPENVRNKFGFGVGGYGSCTPIMHADTVGADIQLDLGRTWFSERGYDMEKDAERGMQWVISQLQELGVISTEEVEE